MEFTEVQASQIMPVSGIETPMGLAKIKNEANDFFFSKGQLPFKIYKNALAGSTGVNKTTADLIEAFFDTLESSLKLQLKENDRDKSLPEKTLIVKEAFDMLRSAFRILNKTGCEFDVTTFYCAIVGFILGKLR
jgi:hypothetical protein